MMTMKDGRSGELERQLQEYRREIRRDANRQDELSVFGGLEQQLEAADRIQRLSFRGKRKFQALQLFHGVPPTDSNQEEARRLMMDIAREDDEYLDRQWHRIQRLISHRCAGSSWRPAVTASSAASLRSIRRQPPEAGAGLVLRCRPSRDEADTDEPARASDVERGPSKVPRLTRPGEHAISETTSRSRPA